MRVALLLSILSLVSQGNKQSVKVSDDHSSSLPSSPYGVLQVDFPYHELILSNFFHYFISSKFIFSGNDTNELLCKRSSLLTDLENKLLVTGWGERGEKGQLGSLGWTRTHCYIQMDNPQGPTVQLRELCSVLYGSLGGRGVWGRMDACVCTSE